MAVRAVGTQVSQAPATALETMSSGGWERREGTWGSVPIWAGSGGGEGRGGWQRGYLCPPTAVHQDPTGGSRAPYPVGPVAEGHSPQDPLVSRVLMKAGERPGARMADSQQHGSL